MAKLRLDQALVARGLVRTRSQAESYIRLGSVNVNGKAVSKPGTLVGDADTVVLTAQEQYVNRAALKLASVADSLILNFKDRIVLDVGSSTGGFTEYALRHGAKKVVAVDVGTDQLHPMLRGNDRIELHEKTDIRNVALQTRPIERSVLIQTPDIILVDVSFISLREVLPHIATLMSDRTQLVAMVKPQFEAGVHQVNKGVIKNDSVRRHILRDFEAWVKGLFIVVDKADSEVAGSKGNKERFYLLTKQSRSKSTSKLN